MEPSILLRSDCITGQYLLFDRSILLFLGRYTLCHGRCGIPLVCCHASIPLCLAGAFDLGSYWEFDLGVGTEAAILWEKQQMVSTICRCWRQRR